MESRNIDLETGALSGYRCCVERLKDILNVVQLLEMSLHENKDDCHVIRSVSIIEGMLVSLMEKDMEALAGELGAEV